MPILGILVACITKKVFKRYKSKYGFVIGLSSVDISDILPLKSRMNDEYKTSDPYLNMLFDLRNKLAKKFGIIPSSFIHDRVIMNIHEKSPKDLK